MEFYEGSQSYPISSKTKHRTPNFLTQSPVFTILWLITFVSDVYLKSRLYEFRNVRYFLFCENQSLTLVGIPSNNCFPAELGPKFTGAF